MKSAGTMRLLDKDGKLVRTVEIIRPEGTQADVDKLNEYLKDGTLAPPAESPGVVVS
jgi:hypothetical protein